MERLPPDGSSALGESLLRGGRGAELRLLAPFEEVAVVVRVGIRVHDLYSPSAFTFRVRGLEMPVCTVAIAHCVVQRLGKLFAAAGEYEGGSAGTLKPSTVRSERGVYERRVLPKWGARKISTLHRAEIETWVATLSASGLAPSSVRHCYVALYKVCRYALHARLITFNPCVGVRLPRLGVPGGKARFLTVAEVERLAGALVDSAPFDLMVRFAAYTGLRAAELVGLRVGDLDLTRGEVSVRQTLQRIDGEWVTGTPKSHRSSRVVLIEHSGLLADLRRYLMQHPSSGDPGALLWPGRAVGSHAVDYSRPVGMSSFRQAYLIRALHRAGLPPMRFHDLRHTSASLWLAAGYSPVEVSRWLGHANVAITDSIYSHLYPRAERPARTKFDALAALAG